MRNIILILLLIVSIGFSKTFTFTTQPDHNTEKLKKNYIKLAQYLQKMLHVDVKFLPTTSYDDSIAAFASNKVQLAWFGALAGIKARSMVPGSTAIVQGFEDTQFYSYIIANTSTKLKKSDLFPKDIVGKSFTFGSKESTSGRLMPEYYIRWILRKTPQEAFSKVGFSGSHSKTISEVQKGEYQVGVVNYAVWDKELKDGKIDTTKVKVIWKSLKYPDSQFSIRGDVDKQFGKGFTRKVQNALLRIKDKEILSVFPRSKFIKANNSEYGVIKGIAKTVGLLK
ncbi:MAG: putative selenate ABC transporter substrate-binding protein [Epsilonproteobacteria bacterium]|nr:putative selenate ABC transporter substrate-binding protein [Campylobacterota bacterium]